MQMPDAGNDWAAMQAQLAAAQKKRKRRFVFWWWFAGLLLLAGGGAGLMYFGASDNANPSSPSAQVQNNNALATPKQGVESANTPSLANAEGNTSPSNYENSINTPDGGDNTGQESSSERRANNSSPKPTQSNGKGNSNSAQTTNAGDGESKPSSTQQQTTTGTEPQNTTADNSPKEGGSEEANETNTFVELGTQATPNGVDSVKTKKEKDAKNAEEANNRNGNPDTETVNRKSKFVLGLGFSALGLNWQSENSTYGQILKQGKRPSGGMQVATNVYLKITENWQVGSGVHINSIRNNGRYNYSHQIYDSVPVLGPNGEIRGYFHVNFRDTTHNYNLSSSYTYITIPLHAMYTIPLTQKTGIEVEGSIEAHYLAFARGQYINPNNLFAENATANNGQFRKLNFGGALRVGYYYMFSNRWRFQADLQMQQMANSLFKPNLGVALRPQSIGFAIGLSYNITK